MPDLSFAGDDESTHSTTTSFSTAYQSIHQPPRQLRRQKTVTQLTRWVSKKVSRSSMRDTPRGNQLSEQNLRELNKASNTETEGQVFEKTSTKSGAASFIKERKRSFATISGINEIDEEERLAPIPEREREVRVRRSYAVFCEEFTLSGSVSPKRVFDMKMGIDDYTEEAERIKGSNTDPTPEFQPNPVEVMPIEHSQHTTQPSLPSASETSQHESPQLVYTRQMEQGTTDSTKTSPEGRNIDLEPQLPTTRYPRPPSPIMTPSVYQELQRTNREKKQAQKAKLFSPFRFLFSKAQPLRGQRCDME